MSVFLRSVILIAFLSFFPAHPHSVSSPRVELLRVPDSGIQPEVAVDGEGTVHLVYLKGDPSQGDLFYAKSKDGLNFSHPIRINSVEGTAIAVGNIRGPRIAIGRRRNVYVAWNASPKLRNPALGRSPMLFSRLDASRTAFEPERNLIQTAYGIDGGGGIAADQQGRVYVFWHAPIPGHQGEEFRRVWVTRSTDDGKSFSPEQIAWDRPTGACGCCSLDAYADSVGRVFVLFRSAQDLVHRDMYLLESTDHGSSFHGTDISKWNLSYCAMSSEAFTSGRTGIFGAWETEKQVHFGAIDPKTGNATDVTISTDSANQKHPALALNRNGLLLVSWTEGMGWKRGGSVHWQLLDSSGKHVGTPGAADGVPPWSLVAAYPRRNGNFVVLY
ncbi:MAG: hypothetical protein WAM39_16985 [Bryobacteraceae bacterium]